MILMVFFIKNTRYCKKDVVDVVKRFFRNGRMLRELNAIEIVLIPKVKGFEVVSQFRPITLCNFTYKVISKMMVNKL